MSALVDTSVWSALFRRTSPNSAEANELRRLILARRARIIGPIRQEVLSGIRVLSQFERLRDELRVFPDIALSSHHFERAAQCFNLCRSRGVQGSSTDFLICAVAEVEALPIFTTDLDF